jgi:hypothetical protein
MEVQVKTRKHTSWDYKHVVNNIYNNKHAIKYWKHIDI